MFIFYLITAALFGLALITFVYTIKTLKFKEYYPIKELGPYLTIVQEWALFVFEAATLMSFLLHYRKSTHPHIMILDNIFTIFLRTSRGMFVFIFLAKGIRIYYAF